MHQVSTGSGRKAWAAVIGALAMASFGAADAKAFDVVEATISDLKAAYESGATTAVEVVQQYLDRIKKYDSRAEIGINSVAQINPSALADAAAIDAARAAGQPLGPLAGVPVLVKNSYDVAGLITTNGVSVLNGANTPGATTLVAPTDSFSVAQLRAAGAIILGKASQSTMAYSYNGIDNDQGVVKNPYSPTRQPGGSSSGSGASIAANLAMFSMGGETGGSIRVPANHNALVGLKTTAGLIDPGGTWPLTPARDVVGPLAKSVSDVAYAMNALVGPSPTNLWNDTPFYPTSDPGTVRPADYTTFLDANALAGKVIAVPNSMNGVGRQFEGNVHPLVKEAFDDALDVMRAQGATIVFVDIPASVNYYNTLARPGSMGGATTVGFGYDYPVTTDSSGNPTTTPSNTWSSWSAAYYYNALIESYNDPVIKNIRDFATALDGGRNGAAGSPLSTLNGAYNNINSLAAIWEAGNAKGFGDADGDGAPDNPDAIKALQAFRDLYIAEYEGFMANPNLTDDPATPFDESTITRIDAFTAPTFAGVVPLQTSILPSGTTDPFAIAGSSFGSLFGRFESNILGVPSISVPMGYLPDGTPMGVQFFNEFLGEGELISFAFDYEQATKWRVEPNMAAFVPEPAVLPVLAAVSLLAMRRRRDSVTALN